MVYIETINYCDDSIDGIEIDFYPFDTIHVRNIQ